MIQDQQLRNQLERLMRGGQAFTPLQEVLKGIQTEDAGWNCNVLLETFFQAATAWSYNMFSYWQGVR